MWGSLGVPRNVTSVLLSEFKTQGQRKKRGEGIDAKSAKIKAGMKRSFWFCYNLGYLSSHFLLHSCCLWNFLVHSPFKKDAPYDFKMLHLHIIV